MQDLFYFKQRKVNFSFFIFGRGIKFFKAFQEQKNGKDKTELPRGVDEYRQLIY